ncbi:uncharacterized protein K452DRAFT_194020, partial [Aplosporella prunicola CBS 121167]
TLLAVAAGISSVSAHGVILSAQGEDGSTPSQGFLLNEDVARNCTSISPCQQDSTIIRDSEIKQNIVNGCGRTEIAGNIDIGEQTEVELGKKRVTKAKKGGSVAVTIHQVNADGAGPYECDLDDTSNSGTNFQKLDVSNNVPGANGLSDAKFQKFTINVALPEDMNCKGGSTGDVCTVRCRNNALAGPFGGCFAIQQTDGTGRADNKTASQITTAQSLDAISKQIQQNKKDFDTAKQANIAAGSPDTVAAAAASALASDPPTATPGASSSSSSGNDDSGNDDSGNDDSGNNGGFGGFGGGNGFSSNGFGGNGGNGGNGGGN